MRKGLSYGSAIMFLCTCILRGEDLDCIKNFKERGAMLVGQRWSTEITIPSGDLNRVRSAIVEHLRAGEWKVFAVEDGRVEAQQRDGNSTTFMADIRAADGGLTVELSFKNPPMISVDERHVKGFLCASPIPSMRRSWFRRIKGKAGSTTTTGNLLSRSATRRSWSQEMPMTPPLRSS